MSTNTLIGLVLGLVVIVGGYVYIQNKNVSSDAMMHDAMTASSTDGAMMHDASSSDAMMKDESATDTMMKDDGTMMHDASSSDSMMHADTNVKADVMTH